MTPEVKERNDAMTPEVKDKPVDFNHLILYAKEWYKRSPNVIVDIKKIMAHRCAMEVEHISEDDVWQCCVMALAKYANPNQIHRYLGELFIPRFNENSKDFKFFEPNCPLERAIQNILTVLQRLICVDDSKNIILNLGHPDSNILPLVDENAMTHYVSMTRKMKKVSE